MIKRIKALVGNPFVNELKADLCVLKLAATRRPGRRIISLDTKYEPQPIDISYGWNPKDYEVRIGLISPEGVILKPKGLSVAPIDRTFLAYKSEELLHGIEDYIDPQGRLYHPMVGEDEVITDGDPSRCDVYIVDHQRRLNPAESEVLFELVKDRSEYASRYWAEHRDLESQCPTIDSFTNDFPSEICENRKFKGFYKSIENQLNVMLDEAVKAKIGMQPSFTEGLKGLLSTRGVKMNHWTNCFVLGYDK
jgi:hypothetical protein